MNLTKSNAYRNLFLLAFCSFILLLTTTVSAQMPCQNPTRMQWASAKLSPVCGMRNGVVSITLPADVSGNYTAALMFKRLGSNDALQPYQGATVSTSTSGGQATITYSGLAENYYCIVISSQGRCFNDDVELRCCPPTKVQWAEAKRHPFCGQTDGMIQYRLSNNPAVNNGVRLFGQVYLTLMYRKLGTNDPLQPVPGAQVFMHDFGTTQENRSETVFATFNNLGPAYYCAIIQTYQGCYNIDIELMERGCNPVCTYTQGAWGSEGGKMSDGLTGTKYSTIQLIEKSLGNYPNKTLIIGNPTGSRLTITTAQQVLDFLPNGGPSFTLTHNYALPLSSFLSTYSKKNGGALIAQAIALGLNLGINVKSTNEAELHLSDVPLEGIVSAEVISKSGAKTVGELFAFANSVIGGGNTKGLSLSQIADALDAINNFFDGCKIYRGPSSVMTASNPGVAVGSLTENLASQNETLKVVAGPNPFRGRVQFQLESAVSGQGVLEVYNVGGVRLATPFRGYVSANKAQTISYEAPSLGGNGLLYVFRVNGEQTSGKLIAAK